MMSPVEMPLPELAQRLAQKQSELEEARRAYQVRHSDLTRQKAELQAQLRTVEAEIKAVSAKMPGGAASAAVPTKSAAPKVATSKVVASKAAALKATAPKTAAAKMPTLKDGPSLPRLLVDLVRAAGGPITVKNLTDKVVRSKFSTTSHNLPRMVKNKVGVLVKRGLLRRAEGQAGVVLGQGKGVRAAPSPKAAASTKPSSSNGKAQPAAAKLADGQSRGALRSLLVQLVAASNRPIKARELAEQVLKKGYKTESREFINVVWDALGKIDEIENVRGKGYQMKKRPAKTTK
jgi:hypothetical protein